MPLFVMNDREERTPRKITVLIVDDHPLFREGLHQALSLEPDIHVVGQVEDGQKALHVTRELQPDVVVLDISLPAMNGLQVARQLKAERASTAVVLLTGYHDAGQVLHAMRAGASAYCAKGVTPEQLVNIIRDAANGLYLVGEERMDERRLEQWIQTNIQAMSGPYIVDADEHFIPLSPREMEILEFVTHGLSNKEIAIKLRISQQTVKNHMTAILKKLNVEDRTQAAVTALRLGWVRMHDTDTPN